jgi:DNA-binding NarL/FixJ family response regulator
VIKVLIADDHAVVRRGLRQILCEESDIHVGAEAGTAADTLALALDQRWDVAVIDVNMPGANGLELLSELRRRKPELPVLVLTMYPEEQLGVRAIRAGAAGFLNKESAPEKLVEAVRKVAGGGRFVSATLAEALASVVAASSPGLQHERLTDREFEVMRLLASGKTVSQVAHELSLSVKTVSTHRSRILQKMNMRTNAELTVYAVKNGLVE